MSTKVAEIASLIEQDSESQWISFLWDKFHRQRSGKLGEWEELRNYIFATDTTTTSNQSLPWKNKTTTPKLCQIRDNLHSNYLSALFPRDDWMKWQAYDKDSATKEKAETIEAYMENKTRIGGFRTEASKLLYDYIDYGNAFATVDFEASYKDLGDGSRVPGFIGPRLKRISPLDIVFNPMATNFEKTFKIVRSIKTVGEIKKMAMMEPENTFWEEAVLRREDIRSRVGQYNTEDFEKAQSYSVDGFGNMYEYYSSDFMEILEFYGDYHNEMTGQLELNKVITVVDRSFTVRHETMPTWMESAPIYHVGWRSRQDNLWHMGPLDNLVGLQYRIDHLENLTADAMDLIVHPPLLIVGEVEEFDWAPGAEIHADENGTVTEVAKSLQGILTAESKIQDIMDKMELMAGAPREAMGIRTPGEKTAFEVGELANAAGRIFQEKITHFEVELLEKVLNSMLEHAVRNMTGVDVIRVLDTDVGAQIFQDITRDDINANGIIRPIGARHFAREAQELQNFIGIMNSPLGPKLEPHLSGVNLTKYVNDVAGVQGYDLFQANVAVHEGAHTQGLVNQAAEDLQVQSELPV